MAVVHVCLVDKRGHPPQHRIGEVVAPQQGLERAVRTVVGQIHAWHVE
jgi:hypothetical protein